MGTSLGVAGMCLQWLAVCGLFGQPRFSLIEVNVSKKLKINPA
jgi:hypothetical protein